MTAVVQAQDLTRRYGRVTAVDRATFAVQEHRIVGLLGRNGAGKTTLMSMLTGQEFATGGEVRLFGEPPLEHARILERTCFIKESQRYPDGFRVQHVLASAPWFLPGWDEAFARELAADFRLPTDRPVRKLSRGQLSAVGVVIGLASRAPITLFDEPYLGLDAVARQLFYDRLLADVAEQPRTVILSTHLIDEVADLLEDVLVIDEGRIIIDSSTETLRGSALAVAGPASAVDAFVAGRRVLHRESIGALATATLDGADDRTAAEARAAALEIAPVSLQQLIVRRTEHTRPTDSKERTA